MPQRYDVIVIGVGTMGSAACCHLAKRGVRVLGLERFDIPHEMGAHGGHSRMFRLSYFEHPDYTPLLRRADALWDELEAESGRRIRYKTGGVYVGRPEGDLVRGSREAAMLHGISHEVLSSRELRERWPQFHVPEEWQAFVEPSAGAIVPEAAVSAHAELALRHGADLRAREIVREWSVVRSGTSPAGGGVRVVTDRDEYEAERLVIAAGPWAERVAGDLVLERREPELSTNAPSPSTPPPDSPQPLLRVTRQVMGWTWPRRPELFDLGALPVYAIEDEHAHIYYGFPILPESAAPGFKIAKHVPAEEADPETVNRQPRREDELDFVPALHRFLPDAAPGLDGSGRSGSLLAVRVCLYTMSPDGHFIIDRHPADGHEHVIVACGFSGHGFKFATVVGEALADLALDGRTELQVGFLGLHRFA